MSIEMHIEYKDGRSSKVTSVRFGTYWRTAVSKLGLQWIPLFEYGMVVENDSIPNIVDELVQMKDYLTEDKNFRISFLSIPKSVRKGMLLEIHFLIEDLNEVRDDPNAEVFIG